MDPALETVLKTPNARELLLALQGVLGNVAAGLTIIFTRPFRVGEYISIAGVDGEVRAVSLFNTTLTHADLSSVVIPNRKIAGEILHSYGEINPALLTVFRERGIEIPVPPSKSVRAG